jgi:predicted GNAT superfamily acetyltransferase
VGLLSPSCREDAYIHFVGVASALRGSGVARRLYLAFHRAMGFTVTGPIADYNGPAVDRILFHRRLDA